MVRKALAQTTIDDALACVTEADLAGGHNFFLLDRDGRGYDVEAMPTATQVFELGTEPLVHTCLLYTSPSPRDRQKSRMPSSA